MIVKYQLKYVHVKQLSAERVLHDHVKNVYVAAPLGVICLIWLVHRLPCAEERLVSQVHFSVDIAACVAVKCEILREGRIDPAQRSSVEVKILRVIQVSVCLRLFVDERSKLLKLWLRIAVDHVHHIRAIVNVLIRVDSYVICE